MKEIWKEAVGNLLTVKSIVTLVLTLVFSVLAVTSRIDVAWDDATKTVTIKTAR